MLERNNNSYGFISSSKFNETALPKHWTFHKTITKCLLTENATIHAFLKPVIKLFLKKC